MDMKDKGLRIRVDQDLRQEFLATCRAQDKPASQVLREFMRQYVVSHARFVQPSLFPVDANDRL